MSPEICLPHHAAAPAPSLYPTGSQHLTAAFVCPEISDPTPFSLRFLISSASSTRSSLLAAVGSSDLDVISWVAQRHPAASTRSVGSSSLPSQVAVTYDAGRTARLSSSSSPSSYPPLVRHSGQSSENAKNLPEWLPPSSYSS